MSFLSSIPPANHESYFSISAHLTLNYHRLVTTAHSPIPSIPLPAVDQLNKLALPLSLARSPFTPRVPKYSIYQGYMFASLRCPWHKLYSVLFDLNQPPSFLQLTACLIESIQCACVCILIILFTLLHIDLAGSGQQLVFRLT